MYDWANSAFVTTIMAAFLPIFFRKVSAGPLHEQGHALATSLWGYISAISMLFVATLSLILGPVADYGSTKKRFLGVFAGLGILFSSLLAVTGYGDWLLTGVFFILAEIGFAVGEVFYDAMLPHVADPERMHAVSAKGYALGYLGGGILLGVNILMLWILPKTLLPSHPEPFPLLGMKLSFLTVGLWWAIFSIPLFLWIPEMGGEGHSLKSFQYVTIAFQRLKNTFSELKKYREAFLFILAFWFYNDGIGTIIKMATAYGDEIGIGTLDLVAALLLTQIVGVPFSFLFGEIGQRLGAKKAIFLGLAGYFCITLGGFFMTKAWHFWLLAGCVGVVQGGTQALSRSLFGSLIPKSKSAEFFAFYNISGKFAGILGPAVFGLIGQLTGTSRAGILSLVFFFLFGGILLYKVDVEKGKKSVQDGK